MLVGQYREAKVLTRKKHSSQYIGAGMSRIQKKTRQTRRKCFCLYLRHHGPVLVSKGARDDNSETLNNSQENSTDRCRGQSDLGTTTGSQATTRQESRSDRVPRVLLLTDALHRTVERGEESTPDSKVSTQDWGTSFQRDQGTWETFTLQKNSGKTGG